MQSLPVESHLQLLGQPTATPSSAPRADATALGSEAFAAALQLVLPGAPAGIPSGGSFSSMNLSALLLGELPATGSESGSSSTTPLANSAVPPENATSLVLPGTVDAAVLASLMNLMPLTPSSAAAAGETDTAAPTATSDPVLALTGADTATTASNGALFASSDMNQARWQLPVVPLPSQLLPADTESLGETQIASQSATNPMAESGSGQLVTVALPAQPRGLQVTDLQANQPDEKSGQAVVCLSGQGSLTPSEADGSETSSSQANSSQRLVSSKQASLPVAENLSQPVSSLESSSSASAKTPIATSAAPLPADTIQKTTENILAAKVLNELNAPNISPQFRNLTSKLAEMGALSLSVRGGNLQSKLADHLQTLSAMEESITAQTAMKGGEAVATSAQQPSRSRAVVSLPVSEDADRKKSGPVATSEAPRPNEQAQKGATEAQDLSARAAPTPKETTAERSEAAPAPRFIVENPKSIRVPGQITVRMEPSELGPLTIDLQTGSSGIIGKLRFASDAVRTTVERDIAQLHRALTDAGIRVERLDVVGAASSGERSSLSSQTNGDHQAPQRGSQGQNRNGQPQDGPSGNGRERGHRNTPAWIDNRQSPWMAMTNLAQGLNLVA